MKVLLVSSLVHDFGGSGKVVESLARELSQVENISISVISLSKQKSLSRYTELGIEYYEMPCLNPLWFGNRSSWGKLKRIFFQVVDSYNIINAFYFYLTVKKMSPDVVHFNKFKGFSPFCIYAAKKSGAKVVITAHDYEYISPDAAMVKEDVRVLLKSDYIRRIYMLPRNFVWKYIDLVTAPSSFVLDKILAGVNATSKCPKAIVLRNPVDTPQHEITCLGSTKTTINLVFLGRLVEEKGILLLLNVMSKLVKKRDDIFLDVYGYGPMERELLKVPSNVRYKGRLAADDKFSTLSQYDYLIVPSLYDEPFGLVVIESYLSGVPVVVSKKGGLAEVFFSGCGQLIDPTEQNFLDVFNNLEKPDRTVRIKCQSVGENYNSKRVAKELIEYYECN
jgi:glycosyltransferase involved in cell wall biosynthesis